MNFLGEVRKMEEFQQLPLFSPIHTPQRMTLDSLMGVSNQICA
jgi:hypothetical protein